MDRKNVNSGENFIQFNCLYAVEFGQKRIMRPETRKFVLGRSESSDLVISSPKVNNKHCEIVCEGDSWMLQNLSPEGTSLVGKAVARDDSVQLGPEAILKIGGIYIQCKSEIERAQPPLRILKINVLIGEKCCHLAADSHSENQPDSQSENQAIGTTGAERMDDSVTEIPAENTPVNMNGEINNIIDSMATENQHLMEELKEMKEALKKTLIEKGDLEMVTAEIQKQLRFYQEEAASIGILGEVMENELQCSICSELLVEAVTLDCSHTFCDYCLKLWKNTNTICPMCRRNITHECKTRVVDSLIDRIIMNLPAATQRRRRELADSRNGRNH